ncbi:MAG: lipoate--protein ligase family protein [Syntrophales bacterium]|nr:lipoate--protein ligase family protein [Syntrophales bacterium]
MATDEAIFRQAQYRSSPPTLRFYGWSKPSVSLGHFQRISSEIDIEVCRNKDIDIVFRPTGGKAVFHDDDFTYAVIAGGNNGFFPDDIMGTYRAISHCLATGLRKLGIEADLADKGRRNDDPERLESSCFSVPAQFELLVRQRKICGSAQVRSRGAFLQHGSILTTFNPEKTYEIMLPHREPREEHVKRLRESVTSIREHTVYGDDLSRVLGSALRQSFADFFKVDSLEGTLTPEEEELREALLKKDYRPGRWTGERWSSR